MTRSTPTVTLGALLGIGYLESSVSVQLVKEGRPRELIAEEIVKMLSVKIARDYRIG